MMKSTWAVFMAAILVWATGCQREQPAPTIDPEAPAIEMEPAPIEADPVEIPEVEEAEEALEEAVEEVVDDAVEAIDEAVEEGADVVDDAVGAMEEAAQEVHGTAVAAVAAVQAAAAQAVETSELAEGFTPIDSSAMKGVLYDAAAETLSIQFPTGDVWDYSGVPAETFEGLMEARSKGRFFVEQIKDEFEANQR